MKIDQEFFSETLADSLDRGDAVLLRVDGGSMRPWLREGDPVRILPAAGRILRRGDIALFFRGPRHPILHRVVRVRRGDEGLFYDCLGDSEVGPPERVSASAVIGVVDATALRRTVYLALNPARRWINGLCRTWGLRLRHG